MRTILRTAAITAAIAGCQTVKPVETPSLSRIEVSLAESSKRAADSITALSRSQRAAAPGPEIDPVTVPEELAQPVTLNWTGPVDRIVRQLAAKAGYTYAALGNRPASPILVDLVALNVPLYRVLFDAGLQTTERATITVNPTQRRIEVRYAG